MKVLARSSMSNSPFLPNSAAQFAWDSTSLGWLKTCPRLYQYHMIEGLRSKGESPHLRFGIEYHHALEFYDHLRANGTAFSEALHATVREVLRRTWDTTNTYITDAEGNQEVVATTAAGWASDHTSKNRFTLLRSVVWYLEEFRDDPAHTVILAEGKPAVELSFRFSLTDEIILSGHLDRLVEFQSMIYVMDRKTTGGTLSGHYFAGYAPDNQMSLYTLAAQVVYNTPAAGVIIDGAQIAVGFSRFGRGFTYRSPDQLEEWLEDTQSYISQAWDYAKRGRWPMNDKSCDKFGGCAFRDICSKPKDVRPALLATDFKVERWNPLEAR